MKLVEETMVARKPHILFVDDEKEFTKMMGVVLRRKGYEVETAGEAGSALQKMRAGGYDLLVTDLNMPGMDGIELIRQVRRTHPEQRIIVITGFPSRESQEEAFKLGTLNYIVKPFSPERFLELIEKSLKINGSRLVGSIELDCEDLIQMCSLAAESLVLEIHKGNEVGRLYFDKGRVVHAETERNEGKAAFFEIQSWRSGIFKRESYSNQVSHTIDVSVDSLLLEGARLQDECSRKESEEKGEKRKDKSAKDKQTALEGESIIRAYLRALRGYDKEVKMAFENMKDLDILRYVVEETDGAIAAGLVSLDGISLGVYSTVEGFDTKAADAEFSSMLRAGQKASANLGDAFGAVEELMLAGANGIVIVRMIGDKYYSGVALAKDGNIGKARMLQKKLVKEMYRRYYGEETLA